MAQDAEVFEGGCHCGAVRYRATLRSRRVVDCNCSICVKKGFLHHFVAKEDFELLRGEDAITTYTFNTHVAKHRFCRHCGIHSFGQPRSHPNAITVNVHCLDGISASEFQSRQFDGQNWEQSIDALRASTKRDQ